VKTVGVVIPTYNAESSLLKLIPLLRSSTLNPRILVIDSTSNDKTVNVAERLGAQIEIISRNEFNHGATREKSRKLINTDIVVMMTQDAYPNDKNMIEHLIKPLIHGEASISYARQIPQEGADIFESFPRNFNYPPKSHIRDISNVKEYGVFTFFCSNSCAAYINKALDEIGGYQPTLVWEDQFAVAKLLSKGHKIAYVAEAVVKHSHQYSLRQEFGRYFDTGYILAENSWFTDIVGSAEGRGKDYLVTLLKLLSKQHPYLIPYAIFNTFVKWVGYKVGYNSLRVPLWLKSLLSGQKHYWSSIYYRG